MSRYLLWDFDGTLGCRIDGLKGRAWSMSMLEAIEEAKLRNKITIEDIDPYLRQGFPWNEPEMPHPEWNNPTLWWAHIRSVFAKVYGRLGFSASEAEHLAQLAQNRYIDLDTWELFPDTLPVLKRLSEHGWRHMIVSNHVPELDDIVRHLELAPYISHIVNSALIGYEKPHPEIYRIALQFASAAERIWMIGDNVVADVLGAERAGIPAILVRNRDERAHRQFADLYELEKAILQKEL